MRSRFSAPLWLWLLVISAGCVAQSPAPAPSPTEPSVSSPSPSADAPTASSPAPTPTKPVPSSKTPTAPLKPSTATEPGQDVLEMTCRGSIQESVDFTVYYSREGGFSRVEFRPRTSEKVLTGNLLYASKDDQGQAVWRGNVEGMADVAVVHLATRPVQRGDQVSVKYDTRWGRATCQ